MGLKLSRKKTSNLLLRIAYKFEKIIPLSAKSKLKLFLDLSWIFTRLAHEQTFKARIQLPPDPEADLLTSFIEKDASVLDIGCGNGYVAKRVLSKTSNIVGIDYDEASVSVAKKEFSGTGVQFFCEDVFHYLKKHPDTKFDYIILSHVLEHIDNPQDFLFLLKDRAHFFFIEVPDFEAHHLNNYRKEIKTDLVYSDADHVSEFDRRELEEIIKNCHLIVSKTEFRNGVMKYWCEPEKGRLKAEIKE